MLLLLLDDLTAITRAHIYPDASRAASGRLLKREGTSRLADLAPVAEGETLPKKTFKDYAPGYLHIDLKELPRMPVETDKSYLCVAPSTCSGQASTAPATGFTSRFCPQDRPRRTPTDGLPHPFDQACPELGAEHRLIPSYRPQTNGILERFNGRIAELLRAPASTVPPNCPPPSVTI